MGLTSNSPAGPENVSVAYLTMLIFISSLFSTMVPYSGVGMCFDRMRVAELIPSDRIIFFLDWGSETYGRPSFGARPRQVTARLTIIDSDGETRGELYSSVRIEKRLPEIVTRHAYEFIHGSTERDVGGSDRRNRHISGGAGQSNGGELGQCQVECVVVQYDRADRH